MSLARNASLTTLRTRLRTPSSKIPARVFSSAPASRNDELESLAKLEAVHNINASDAQKDRTTPSVRPARPADIDTNPKALTRLLKRLNAALHKPRQRINHSGEDGHGLSKREKRSLRRALKNAQETVEEIQDTLHLKNSTLAKQAEDLMRIGSELLEEREKTQHPPTPVDRVRFTTTVRPTLPKSNSPNKESIFVESSFSKPPQTHFSRQDIATLRALLKPDPGRQEVPEPRGPKFERKEFFKLNGPKPDVQEVPKSSHSSEPKPPVHEKRRTPKYSRRIEGFLKPLDGGFTLQDLPPPSLQNPVAHLAHGLDRVLFNPGVYWLQDPRSRVYNFSPWLQKIPKVQNFAFERVQTFTPSSEDSDLHKLAKLSHARYTGSTSSLTGMLSQIYLMLSCERPVNLSTLSQAFHKESTSYTVGQKFPVATKLIYKDGVYSTDSFSHTPGLSDRNVLTWMGTMLEKFLTLPEEQFKPLLRDSPHPTSESQAEPTRDAFRFAKIGNYVMRSQLDCFDSRLPGTGVFDIKTRAAMPIRLDIMNWEENSGYSIHKLHGRVESFEREYYDLIRSAFLKYSFQARIGNMDGVMVAYHNTARIFGFQYIPLEEMDERLYGNKHAGPLIFSRCVELLQIINDEITHHFPEQSVRCLWDAKPEEGALKIWAQPHDWAGVGSSPIVELQVTTTNYLGDKQTRGQDVADHLPDQAWSVEYSISTSSDDPVKIRERYWDAVNKQKKIFDLPTGVDINEMEELWEQMDFSGDDSASPVAFKPELFRPPTAMAERTRRLARRGKERMDRLEREAEGQPVVIYSQTEPPQIIKGVDLFSSK